MHFYKAHWTSHPLQQTHLLEVRAGVGQPLQSVRQIIVSAEVKAVCSQHIVNHGQEGLILLRLEEERKQIFRCQENSCRSTFERVGNCTLMCSSDAVCVSSVCALNFPPLDAAKYIYNYCLNHPPFVHVLMWY